MEQYLIDKNAISHYLSELMSDLGMSFMDSVIDMTPNLSVITQIELLSWNGWKNSQITSFIEDSLIFNISPEVVSFCVNIRKERKIKTPDVIIAATALANGFILVTDNVRDFDGIPNLRIINPKNL